MICVDLVDKEVELLIQLFIHVRLRNNPGERQLQVVHFVSQTSSCTCCRGWSAGTTGDKTNAAKQIRSWAPFILSTHAGLLFRAISIVEGVVVLGLQFRILIVLHFTTI
jgi:hypothetical protein